MEPVLYTTSPSENPLTRAVPLLVGLLPKGFIVKEVVPCSEINRLAIFTNDELVAIVELSFSGYIATITIHMYEGLPDTLSTALIGVLRLDSVISDNDANKVEIEVFRYDRETYLLSL